MLDGGDKLTHSRKERREQQVGRGQPLAEEGCGGRAIVLPGHDHDAKVVF